MGRKLLCTGGREAVLAPVASHAEDNPYSPEKRFTEARDVAFSKIYGHQMLPLAWDSKSAALVPENIATSGVESAE